MQHSTFYQKEENEYMKKKAHDSVTIQHTRMHTILDFMLIGHSSWANVCIEFP